MRRIVRQQACRSLMVIDQLSLRAAEVQRCQQVLKKLERSRRELAAFEENCLPTFNQWVHRNFGRELTLLRELRASVEEQEQLILAIRDEVQFSGASYRKAYERIMKFKESFRQSSAFNFGEGGETQSEAGSESGETNQDDRIRKIFEALFGTRTSWDSGSGDYESAFNDFRASFGAEEQPNEREASTPYEDGRLKNRYRQLARKLHPDLNPNQDSRKKELWHQVRTAYEARDLNRLDMLATMLDAYFGSFSPDSSISEIRQVRTELSIALREYQKRLRASREHPAWKFSEVIASVRLSEAFQGRMRADLEQRSAALSEKLEKLRSQVRKWAAPPPRSLNMRRKHVPEADKNQLELF
jgi:hypothetical protein